MDNIKKLYYRYQNSEEYGDLDEMPEVIEAHANLDEFLQYFDGEDYRAAEDLAGAYASANEMQGFVYGFQYAMLLATDRRWITNEHGLMNCIADDISDHLVDIDLALKKGLLILGDLTEEYPFDGGGKEKTQAWAFEYERITTHLGIAFDYMFEASRMVDKIREMSKGGAAV